MAGVFGAAALPFIGCVALLAATILHVLAFAAPYWAFTEIEGNFGLWRLAKCLSDDPRDCYRYNMHWSVADWLNAVRALECLTIIFWTIPLMIIPVYIYVALGLHYRCLFGCLSFSVLVGAVCNIIGDIVYGVQIGVNEDWRLGWCLVVSIIGGALGFVSFVILLIATFNRPSFAIERHYPSGFYVDPDKNRLYTVETFDRVETLSEKSNPAVITAPPE